MTLPPIDLLCLPCAGASATMYLRWRRLLPAWLQIVPVELPGRGARWGEPHATDLDTLVAQLCDAHGPARRRPYVLFGHSMGALLAYGMAQEWRARAQPLPQALWVSGSPAPALREPARHACLHTDAALIADLRRQGGTPDEVFASPEMLALTLAALRADYAVCASFRQGVGAAAPAPLTLPVFACGGRSDAIAPARLQAWRHETLGAFSLAWFDGGHFFIRQSEPALLATLVADLTALFAPSLAHHAPERRHTPA